MIVDTSVWIDFFNGHDSPPAERLALALRDGERVLLTGLICTEILLGLRTEQEAARIEVLLEAFDWVADPNRADHVQAAALYRRCRAKGVLVRSTIDCLIAQLCLRDQVPLLTKDRDFERMATHTGLQLVRTG